MTADVRIVVQRQNDVPCALYAAVEASHIVCQYLSNDSCPRSYGYVNEREI